MRNYRRDASDIAPLPPPRPELALTAMRVGDFGLVLAPGPVAAALDLREQRSGILSDVMRQFSTEYMRARLALAQETDDSRAYPDGAHKE